MIKIKKSINTQYVQFMKLNTRRIKTLYTHCSLSMAKQDQTDHTKMFS